MKNRSPQKSQVLKQQMKEDSKPILPQRFCISKDHAERRIDNYLLSQLKNVPKSVLYRYLRQGRIRVNKKRIKPLYRLQENDEIVIYALRPPMSPSLKLTIPSSASIKKLSTRILYEDDELLILNKPVGMAVHGGSDIPLGVIEILRYARGENAFLELAHRLDRETSGCLVIAKKRSILRELHKLFREGGVKKTYYALTLGHWSQARNRISVELKKNFKISGERKVTVNSSGKKSITDFYVVRDFPSVSFVEVKLHTGRTHQIRVHAQYAGHPIAGDEKYGDDAFNRVMKHQGLKRLFLHAANVSFLLSSKEKNISVEAPLDEELQTFLDKLG